MTKAQAILSVIKRDTIIRYEELSNDEKKELAIRILHDLNGDHPMTEQFEGVCLSLAFDPKQLQS